MQGLDLPLKPQSALEPDPLTLDLPEATPESFAERLARARADGPTQEEQAAERAYVPFAERLEAASPMTARVAAKETRVVEKLPVVGMFAEGGRLLELHNAAKRLEAGEDDDADRSKLRRFVAEGAREKSIGYHATSTLFDLPAYAVDFWLTGGAAKAAGGAMAKTAIGKAIGEAVASKLRGVMETGAGRVLERGVARAAERGLIGKAAQAVAAGTRYAGGMERGAETGVRIAAEAAMKAAFQTALMAPRVVGTGVVRTLDGKIKLGEEGQLVLQGTVPDFVNVIGQGALDMWAQNLGEYSGGMLSALPPIQQIELLQRKVLGEYVRRVPGATIENALEALKSGAHWDGFLGEIGEEHFTSLLKTALLGDPISDVWPGWKAEVGMALGFAAMPAGGAAIHAGVGLAADQAAQVRAPGAPAAPGPPVPMAAAWQGIAGEAPIEQPGAMPGETERRAAAGIPLPSFAERLVAAQSPIETPPPTSQGQREEPPSGTFAEKLAEVAGSDKQVEEPQAVTSEEAPPAPIESNKLPIVEPPPPANVEEEPTHAGVQGGLSGGAQVEESEGVQAPPEPSTGRAGRAGGRGDGARRKRLHGDDGGNAGAEAPPIGPTGAGAAIEPGRSGSEGGGIQRPGGAGEAPGPESTAGAGSEIAPGPELPRGARAENYRISDEDQLGAGGPKAKARANLEAVKILKRLQAEKREATPEEQRQLVKYVGWGAVDIRQNVFPDPNTGEFRPGWEAEGKVLRELLSEEEYSAAKTSSLNAHYTSAGIVRGIYGALQRLGFGKGRILEPGMGIGHFAGLMPEAMARGSRYTGIERDPISAGIAKALYPRSRVLRQSFEAFQSPHDYYDVAVGNPPFADIKILADPEYRKHGFALHDYFFAKSLDRVRPGGLVVFITSKGTMDKSNDKARAYLAERADLVGAIRLPQTAFKENAGTEVVTDVLFLRKREKGEAPKPGIAWQDIRDLAVEGGTARVNEYFANHPEMVLGRHALAGTMYRKDELTVLPHEDRGTLEEQFAKAVESLPSGIYRESVTTQATAEFEGIEPDLAEVKEGGYYVGEKGELLQKQSGVGVAIVPRQKGVTNPHARFKTHLERIRALIPIRDARRKMLDLQLRDASEEVLAGAQKRLEATWLQFTRKFGPINQEVWRRDKKDRPYKRTPNLAPFLDDPDAWLTAAVEDYDAESNTATLREMARLRIPRVPDIRTVQDALNYVLAKTNKVDLAEIGKLAGLSEKDAIEQLGAAIYRDPASGAWQSEDAYLSGNVRVKLAQAEVAAKADKLLARNVEALQAIVPEDIPSAKIHARMGSPWIPEEEVQRFVRTELGLPTARVAHSGTVGVWGIELDSSDEVSAANVIDWGTQRVSASKLVAAALNNQDVIVYDSVRLPGGGESRVKNEEQTAAAGEKLQRIKTAFVEWIFADEARAEKLARIYNDTYNSIVPRQFDGRQLTLPGSSHALTLREHQKNAVWRILQHGNTYMAHGVGAGKTMAAVAAGMEMRRLGLAKKPMYVVPNHMLKQFTRETLALYPNAKVMVADEVNFQKNRRRGFVARMGASDLDAVIITHSAFKYIPVAPEFEARFVREQIKLYEDALADIDQSERTTRAQIEKKIEKMRQRLHGLADMAKDAGPTFEESGVDFLFVDEAQEFRKLQFFTNRSNMKGIQPEGSQRAWDLYMKSRYLEGVRPGRNLVLMSGTPVTNTLAEMFTLQRYLQEGALAENGIHLFDAWASMFGETVTQWEAGPGGSYAPVTRFARFTNLPELMRLVLDRMDVKRVKDLAIPRPDVKGGPQLVLSEKSSGLKRIEGWLRRRIDAIRKRRGKPEKGMDILLSVITDGRHAALDTRFITRALEVDADSKLNRVVQGVFETWEKTRENEYAGSPIKGASQMVFSDLGLPGMLQKRGFSAYTYLRDELVKRGVPKEEIAFMQDYKKSDAKEQLFAAVNSGRVRILIGSTGAMGTGVNAQARLIAMHHVDAPWRPADVEQREGRIVRQGNQNKAVEIYRYATKGSYDTTMWQILETKQRFIDQLFAGDFTLREMEDIDGEADQYAMAKAMSSGDERLIQVAGLEADLVRLYRQQGAHESEQVEIKRQLAVNKELIPSLRNQIAGMERLAKERTQLLASPFEIQIGPVRYTEREKAIEPLRAGAAATRAQGMGTWHVGKRGAFELSWSPRELGSEKGRLVVQAAPFRWESETLENPSGAVLMGRVERAIGEGFDEAQAGMAVRLERLEKQSSEYEGRKGQTFKYAEEIAAKEKELAEVRVALGADSAKAAPTGDEEEWTPPERVTVVAEPGDEEAAREGEEQERERLVEEEAEAGEADVYGSPSRPGWTPRPPPDRIAGDSADALWAGYNLPYPVTQPTAAQAGFEEAGETAKKEVIDAFGEILVAAGSTIPIRFGHVKGKRAGQFSPRQGVIRTRVAYDLVTAAHETGHGLEVAIYGNVKGSPWGPALVSSRVQRELVTLGKALYGSRKPAGGYKREGWAEFMRLVLMEDYPSAALAQAPNLTTWFRNDFLPQHQEVAKAIEAARAVAERYRKQGALKRGAAQIVDPTEAKRRLAKVLRRTARDFSYANLFEMGAPIEALERFAREHGFSGIGPFQVFESRRMSAPGMVREWVENGIGDIAGNKTGPALAAIRGLVKGRYDDFLLYLYARRALALWYDPRGPRDPGITVEDAQAIKDELDSPAFQQAAADVWAWNDGVLSYAAQGSPSFARQIAKIRAHNSRMLDGGAYVPLQRVFDDISDAYRILKGKPAGSPQGGSVAARLRGSGRQIKDPLQVMIAQAERLVSLTHRRMVLDRMIAISEQVTGMGDLIEEVPTDVAIGAKRSLAELLEEVNRRLEAQTGIQGQHLLLGGAAAGQVDLDEMVSFFAPADSPKGRDPIIPIWKDGRVRWFRVNEELFHALAGMDPASFGDGTFDRIIKATLVTPASIARAGFTSYRLAFGWLTNPTIDFGSLYLKSRSKAWGGRLFLEFVNFWSQAAVYRFTGGKFRTPYMEALIRLGGEMTLSLSQDSRQAARAARKIAGWRVVDVPRQAWEIYKEVIQFPEIAARAVELKLVAQEIGWKPGTPMTLEQSLQLAIAFKQVTIDFTAAGEFARKMNMMIPFFNVAFQGPRSLLAAFKRNPVRVSWRILSLAIPTLLLWWRIKDEDWWKEMADRERFMYWHIPITIEEDKALLRIPRGSEIGSLMAFFEAFAEGWYRSNPREATTYFTQFLEVNAPPMVPVLPGEAAEQLANYDFFWQRPIVPGRLLEKPVGQQVTEYTTRAATAIGRTFGVSPVRVDHAIKNTLGGGFTDLLDLVGLGSQATREDPTLADTPLIGRLFAKGGQVPISAKSTSRLFDRLEEMNLRERSEAGETPYERQERLQLEDAVAAISVLSTLRRQALKAQQRADLSREILSISQDALRDVEGENLNRPLWKQTRKQAERELELSPAHP